MRALRSSDDGEVTAQSRNRKITPSEDNQGFARWVHERRDELLNGLGPGYHFGEFWGHGIQRRYGLSEKRFSLFNVLRWTDDVRPACCHVVPLLARGVKVTDVEREALAMLAEHGSFASDRFANPEGIVLFHAASGHGYKVAFDGDGHKGNV